MPLDAKIKKNTYDFIDNARPLHKQARVSIHDETMKNTLISKYTDPYSGAEGAVSK